MKFKAGDIVRCIDDINDIGRKHTEVTLGHMYVITRIINKNHAAPSFVTVKGNQNELYQRRFILVENPTDLELELLL